MSNSLFVGTMYENRKTHKTGVCESYDEKYKTLLMRDAEGNSFNITLPTFKSLWRKYKGEETIQTSTQVTAEREQKEAEEKKATVKKETVEKKKVGPKKKSPEFIAKVKDAVTSLISDPYKVITTTRGGIKIKRNRRIMFELWAHGSNETISFLVDDETYKATDYTIEGYEPKYEFHSTYKVPHEFEISLDYLKFFVDKTIETINTIKAENTKETQAENTKEE